MSLIDSLKRVVFAAVLGLVASAIPTISRAAQPDSAELDPRVLASGAEIFSRRCAGCHAKGEARTPSIEALRKMPPEIIVNALTQGLMRQMAVGMKEEDIRNVAQFVAQRPLIPPRAPLMCENNSSPFDFNEPPPFVGWGFTYDNKHEVSSELAGIDPKSVRRLKLKWALAYPETSRIRSQPGIAGGAIYASGQDGTVFALDRTRGCARWTFKANAGVRSAFLISSWKAGDRNAQPMLYFGDASGYVYAVDAVKGVLAWSKKTDPHPNVRISGTPILYNDRLFVPVSSIEEAASRSPAYECCTFRGSLIAYDAQTGEVVWQTHMTDRPTQRGHNSAGARRFGPSGVSLWNSPALDEKRGRIYIGTAENYSEPATSNSDSVLAIDVITGKVVWTQQVTAGDIWNTACDAPKMPNCPDKSGPDYGFGSGPIFIRAQNEQDFVVAGEKSGFVYALDADTGNVKWKSKVGRGGVNGGVSLGIAAQGSRIFVPINDSPDGRIYAKGDEDKPGLYALDLVTGRIIWRYDARNGCNGRKDCQNAGLEGAISVTPQLIFAGSQDGRLRAYDSASGKVLWEFDAVRDFKTVNGTLARGGSIAGGAPLPYRGMLFVNSGYSTGIGLPGNMLFAFEVN